MYGVELRVLGPLEVVEGDEVRPTGGRRQRALLADLVMHANQVVSADRLIDDVWWGEPPASAPHALHVYVSRLRKVLGGNGAELASRPPGYVLEVDPEAIDLTRFEHLVGEGRQALANGQADGAVSALRRAVDLWRGEAFADLADEPFLVAETVRLNDLHLAALEDLAEAELAVGRHAEVLPTLRRLVADHPTRERARVHLMLALYRSGRQAEALEVFEQGREALAEELGIDPGKDLQRLHRAVLQQDPSLEWVPPVTREPPAQWVRKLVSSLVTVVRVSRPDGEPVDPEALPVILRRVADRVRTAVERHGGTQLPPGPAGPFPAVFGVPVAHEDDALRAVRAGVELRDDLERLGAELNRDRGVSLDVRVAAATGDALAQNRSNPAVSGEVFAEAEHLAVRAEPGDVLIDAATNRLVANAVRVEAKPL